MSELAFVIKSQSEIFCIKGSKISGNMIILIIDSKLASYEHLRKERMMRTKMITAAVHVIIRLKLKRTMVHIFLT